MKMNELFVYKYIIGKKYIEKNAMSMAINKNEKSNKN